MSKSKVIVALLTGVLLGGALVYGATRHHKNESNIDDAENMNSLDTITKQFADKLATELKTAEKKIKQVVKNDLYGISPERELGLFL